MKTYQQLDPRENEQFWTKIWQPKEHNKKAEWISNMTKEPEGLKEDPKTVRHIDLLKTTLEKYQIGNRQAMMKHGFWFNKFTAIYDRLALEMNKYLQGIHVTEWMTKGKTTLIHKDTLKETAPNNYRACLLMIRKILTAQISEEIYYSLTSLWLFSEEQKGCNKGSRGTAELL